MIINNKELNLSVWFSKRELDFCPKHFVRTNTTLTANSERWIIDNLVGRYHLETLPFSGDLFAKEVVPAFEDPAEAILYELTWS